MTDADSSVKRRGRPRKVAPADAIQVGSHMMVRRPCPGCGKPHMMKCYREPTICAECNKAKAGTRNLRHGMSGHPLYKIWELMMARCGHIPCSNEKLLDLYARRGITVCEEWRDDRAAFFDWALKSGWAPGLQIDREKNHLGYSPGNCRFVTSAVNNQNRRNTKLDVERVREIRSRLSAGEAPWKVARAYGINEQYIYSIKNNRVWKNA